LAHQPAFLGIRQSLQQQIRFMQRARDGQALVTDSVFSENEDRPRVADAPSRYLPHSRGPAIADQIQVRGISDSLMCTLELIQRHPVCSEMSLDPRLHHGGVTFVVGLALEPRLGY
jgi:hypothetical protein